jgi:hypothetical protein
VLLVVSHTAANAIAQLLQSLPLVERTVIMNLLEAISHHDLVAHGRDVRLHRNGRNRSGYAMLLRNFRNFVYDTDQDWDTGTDEDSETAVETAAAVALGDLAEIVLGSMQALQERVQLIRRLHQEVDARVDARADAFRPMDAVNQGNNPEVSELSSVPSNDVVNHGDDDRETNTV